MSNPLTRTLSIAGVDDGFLLRCVLNVPNLPKFRRKLAYSQKIGTYGLQLSTVCRSARPRRLCRHIRFSVLSEAEVADVPLSENKRFSRRHCCRPALRGNGLDRFAEARLKIAPLKNGAAAAPQRQHRHFAAALRRRRAKIEASGRGGREIGRPRAHRVHRQFHNTSLGSNAYRLKTHIGHGNSALEKDYVHIVTRGIEAERPRAVLKRIARGCFVFGGRRGQ